MARQFEIHAMESTTTEFMEAFSMQYPTLTGLRETLEQLLMLADLVKFAKEDPSESENERHMNNAFDFVEKTYRMFDHSEMDNDDTLSQKDRENVADREVMVETVKEEAKNE